MDKLDVASKAIRQEVLTVANNLLVDISQYERERAISRSRKMYQSDRDSDIATAEDRGAHRGRAEGILDVALNALRKNMSVEDIIDITGLTREEIKSLC